MNPEERLRTASVFKVLVMAGTLLEAQGADRSRTSWERSHLVPMITESANNPGRALWHSFGASPWFHRQADVFGLEQTTRSATPNRCGGGRRPRRRIRGI